MDSSFIHLLKIDTSARIFFFFLYFRFFCLCQSEQHLYISPKNRPKELCPKECVYKLPINTLNTRTHAHARTHANSVHPLVSSLRALPAGICRTRSLLSAS